MFAIAFTTWVFTDGTNKITAIITISSPKITSEQAKEIANQHIEQSGWYAGTPTLSADRTVWYVPIYDQSGNTVDSMEINANTGVLIGKG